MKDKVTLLMDETGCDRSEAELALELCGYDFETAIQAVPRLFQNILVFKARAAVRSESLYGLLLVILDLKEKSLLRARAVLSYNPAVYASELDQHWFDFEARLYACRLWAGALQELSQETEKLLGGYFGSKEARSYYKEETEFGSDDFEPLRELLSRHLGGPAELDVRQDNLARGEFQEVRPHRELKRAARRRGRKPAAPSAGGPGLGPGGLLVIQVSLEEDPEGADTDQLRAGDLVYAVISDSRDIAQYLARLFGTRTDEGSQPLLVPVEAIEKDSRGEVTVRVRFSAGVCGDVTVRRGARIRRVRKPSRAPWWKKIFGG